MLQRLVLIRTSLNMEVKTSIERAFELAKSDRCRSMFELNKLLKAEKYGEIYTDGKSLKKQLLALIEKAREQSNTR